MLEEKNLYTEDLLDRYKIFLASLHIKLVLIKQFQKTLNKEKGYFDNICRKPPFQMN